MPGPFRTERLASFHELLSQHFSLLAHKYSIPAHDPVWHQLQTYVCSAQGVDTDPPGQGPSRDYLTSLKILVVNHWQVYRTQEEEPPPYLIAAVDAIEQSCPAWFSYEKEAWIEE